MGEVSEAALVTAAMRHWAICGGILSASWTTYGNIGSDISSTLRKRTTLLTDHDWEKDINRKTLSLLPLREAKCNSHLCSLFLEA